MKFHCQVNDISAEVLVNGMAESISVSRLRYVHIDVEIPHRYEECDLKVEVKAGKCKKKLECSWDSEDIVLFHDEYHLHFDPFTVASILDDEYRLGPDECDSLIMTLYKNGKEVLSKSVRIEGPWPDGDALYPDSDETDQILARLDKMPGQQSFKQYINDMVVRCRVERARLNSGLAPIPPRLHTVLIGDSFADLNACAGIMAETFRSLGLISVSELKTVNVSGLQIESITGVDSIVQKMESAQDGVLVFENAHMLYKPEYKPMDVEPQIIRAIIDTLGNRADIHNWMMILTGRREGVESLLAANPDLRILFSDPIYLDEFGSQDYTDMIDTVCSELNLMLTDQARKKLEMYILHKKNYGGEGVGGGELLRRLFQDKIVPAMFRRIDGIENPSAQQLMQVEVEDIPTLNANAGEAMAQLDALVGLGGLKTKIKDYLNVVRLANLRMEKGLPTMMPRLHMAFLGNPGTGKTTVAEIIGKVFASWGILSNGKVIRTEKSRMVGQYIGETEFKMRNLLERARGNVLFIDEAYQLVEGGDKDFGRIVMNSLLTELGNDQSDMVVILAGYTAPMKKLLASNEGVESRFPNVFNFEDYTTDELLEIAHIMIGKQGLKLSEGAESKLRDIIDEESRKPSPRFGNGRFVSNLIQNQILATMGSRISDLASPTVDDLNTILPQDIVIDKKYKEVVFDDQAIDAALKRLDSLSGLANVKKAVRNFVQSARYLHSIGEPYVGKGLLSWRFIGKSGTGKSTVAEIMARILKGMHLIANSNITQFKAQRLMRVSDHDYNALLQDLVKKSCNGLIFIDADESQLGIYKNDYANFVEGIRLKLEELTVESGGECALILAELDAPNKTVAEQLTDSGIYEFDHTLVFKDFTDAELYEILCNCLLKFNITFTPPARNHIMNYISSLNLSYGANARTMKLMSRTIHQQVILRESGLTRRPKVHQVQLADVETFKWNNRKGRVGY